jgi:hypothetical protein
MQTSSGVPSSHSWAVVDIKTPRQDISLAGVFLFNGCKSIPS